MSGIGETEGQGWVSLTFGLMRVSPEPMLGVLRLEEGGEGGEIVEWACAAGRGM